MVELKQISKWFVISGAVIIWIIKFIVRPLHLFEDPVKFCLGIAPNLVGSFLIPFGAYWFFSSRNFMVARVFRIQNSYDLRLICLLGFGMLVVNEYLQQIPLFGRTFDYNDIFYSFVGLMGANFVFKKIQQRYQRHTN